MCNHAIYRPVAVFPSSSRVCELAFPGRLDQVREARALLGAFLRDWPAAGDAFLLLSDSLNLTICLSCLLWLL